MALIAPRRRARLRWAALVVLVGGALGLLGVPGATATVPWYGSDYFAVVDQDGANDVPGQVDVTMMGRDDTDAGTYRIFMAWDSIDQWTGTGQTGDACALFDSDGDGNINFVVCGSIHNPDANPETVTLENANVPYAFTCGDKKNDRCTTPTPETYTFGTQITAGDFGFVGAGHQFDNLVMDTDPFADGTSHPYDSVLEVAIAKSFLPTGATLVNVCSYPSAGNGGNNNPFDCVTGPGGGFIKVVKDTGAATTADFDFTFSRALVTGDTTATIGETTGSPATGTTGALGIVLGNALTITETQPSTDWVLQGVACTKEGGASTGTADTGNNKITGVAIESGKVTTCTFTDRTKPTLTLKKVVTNDAGGTSHANAWTLTATPSTGTAISGTGTLDTGTTADDASYGPTTAQPAVQYTLTESSVSGYAQDGNWSCTGGTFVAPNKVTLAYGDDVTCTVTNNDTAPQLSLKKVVTNNDGGTTHADAWTLTATPATGSAISGTGTLDSGTAADDATYGPQAAVAGVWYTLTESTISGYSAGSWTCSGTGYTQGTGADANKVKLDLGASATCQITNSDVGPQLSLKKVVTNDSGLSTHADAWTLTATPTSGTAISGTGTLDTVSTADDATFGPSGAVAGVQYTLTESAVTGYSQVGSWSCTGGTFVAPNKITLGLADTVTCTVTNDDQPASPSIGTTMSWTLNDALTLSGFRTGGTGGTASFYLYKGDATCSDPDKLVWSQLGVSVDNTTGTAATTTGHTTSTSGTYYWYVTYSGNDFNASQHSTCGDETTTLP